MWSMWSSSNSSRSNAVSQVKLITSIEVLHVLKFNWTTSILFISNKLHKSLELLTCSDWLNLLCYFGFENYCSEWVGIRWRMVPHSCEVILLSQCITVVPVTNVVPVSQSVNKICFHREGLGSHGDKQSDRNYQDYHGGMDATTTTITMRIVTLWNTTLVSQSIRQSVSQSVC